MRLRREVCPSSAGSFASPWAGKNAKGGPRQGPQPGLWCATETPGAREKDLVHWTLRWRSFGRPRAPLWRCIQKNWTCMRGRSHMKRTTADCMERCIIVGVRVAKFLTCVGEREEDILQAGQGGIPGQVGLGSFKAGGDSERVMSTTTRSAGHLRNVHDDGS